MMGLYEVVDEIGGGMGQSEVRVKELLTDWLKMLAMSTVQVELAPPMIHNRTFLGGVVPYLGKGILQD